MPLTRDFRISWQLAKLTGYLTLTAGDYLSGHRKIYEGATSIMLEAVAKQFNWNTNSITS